MTLRFWARRGSARRVCTGDRLAWRGRSSYSQHAAHSAHLQAPQTGRRISCVPPVTSCRRSARPPQDGGGPGWGLRERGLARGRDVPSAFSIRSSGFQKPVWMARFCERACPQAPPNRTGSSPCTGSGGPSDPPTVKWTGSRGITPTGGPGDPPDCAENQLHFSRSPQRNGFCGMFRNMAAEGKGRDKAPALAGVAVREGQDSRETQLRAENRVGTADNTGLQPRRWLLPATLRIPRVVATILPAAPFIFITR